MKQSLLYIISLLGLLFYQTSYSSVDTQTLDNKVMMGYQGWFTAAGDSNGTEKWKHWARDSQIPDGSNLAFDMYPDLREYEADELFDTAMTIGGNPAKLYSPRNPKTVRRHFKWMREYGIDGVFMQRFITTHQHDVDYAAHMDQVLLNGKEAAEAEGRAFAVMYDVSGCNPNRVYYDLIQDWMHLVDTHNITQSFSYMNHDNRPVLGIWGLGFTSRDVDIVSAQALIDWLKHDAPPKYRVTVLGGVPTHWHSLEGDSRTEPEWGDLYSSYDIISPWTVGRYYNPYTLSQYRAEHLEPGMQLAAAAGADYMPVIFPGFSWKNLKGGTLNQIPRSGGRFYWQQVYHNINAGNNMLYIAMFDEVDEGTAMFKTAETLQDCPIEADFLTLNADGFNLPSDWYLQLANETGKVLRGEQALTSQMPIGNLPQLSLGNYIGSNTLYNSTFVSQEVPEVMDAGESYTIRVTMRNTGNRTWISSESLRDVSYGNDFIWGLSNARFRGSTIPNRERTVIFNITAPEYAGDYKFQWKMFTTYGVDTFFGHPTPKTIIKVEGPPPPPGYPYGSSSSNELPPLPPDPLPGPVSLIDRTNEVGATVTSEFNDSAQGQTHNSIFDNDDITKYLTNNASSWVAYQFPNDKKYTVVRYSITASEDSPKRDPFEWTLSGSNDGNSWEILDEQEKIVFPRRLDKLDFIVSNQTAYSHYKFEATSSYENKLQFAEIELFSDDAEDGSGSSTNNSYSVWKTALKISDDFSDEDNDGLANIAEFALGRDPFISDKNINAPEIGHSSNNLDFKFHRERSQMRYIIESSSDLINWSDYTIVDDSHGVPGSDATVPVPTSSMSNGKIFLRLKVEDMP